MVKCGNVGILNLSFITMIWICLIALNLFIIGYATIKNNSFEQFNVNCGENIINK